MRVQLTIVIPDLVALRDMSQQQTLSRTSLSIHECPPANDSGNAPYGGSDPSRDTPIAFETTANIREVHKSRIQTLSRRGPSASQHISRPILYNEGVQAQWRETTVGEHGELVLHGLPFAPGQPVEVLVVSKTAASTTAGGRSLRDSVFEFREPLEPVASEDWDALL